MSERNSVAEFEMLEQECIAKYLENPMDKSGLDTHDREARDLINGKVQELEFEIEKFKLEKAKVQELQRQYEEQLARVTLEIEDFENRKGQELEEIQAWK